jgi:hypothetical protein
MSEEARRQKIEAARNNHPSDGERLHLPWQNASVDAPVINLPLEAVLLNHRSHRIRAQIESHSQNEQIASDPFGEQAQETVAQILRDTEDFGDLKTNLSQEGQRDAGVVTRAGILVNGNTRAVALRDLGEHYIRAAVLPADASQEELDELELRLQMRREFKQEYTFTNELLFVDDLLNRYGRLPNEIALALGWAAADEPLELRRGGKRVQQAQQLLSLTRNVQAVSGGTRPLTYFDDKRQTCIEINNIYQELVSTNPNAAQRVRDARLLAMFAGLGYRELREIDVDFVPDHLLPAMENDDLLRESVLGRIGSDLRDGEELPGLDAPGLGTEPSENDVISQLLRALSRGTSDEVLILPSGDGNIELTREPVVDALRASLDMAVEEAEADRRAGGRLTLPLKLLIEVTKKLARCAKEIEEVGTDEGFDRQAFREGLASFERSVDSLRRAAEGSLSE